MTLFPNEPGIHTRPKKYAENIYKYYCESTRDHISFIKNNLENWFSHYPPDEQKEIKSRFPSEFDSVFYELFLHELLLKMNFSVDIHADLTNGEKRADFLVTATKGDSFVLEARIRTFISKKEKMIQKLKDTIYDYINDNLSLKDFFLSIDRCRILSNSQPSSKNICETVKMHLENIEHSGEAPSKIHIKDSSIEIKISFIKRTEKGDITVDRPIGAHMGEAHWSNPAHEIRKGLDSKASRYGQLEQPYIIALNCLDSILLRDVVDALFGDTAGLYEVGHGFKKWVRKKNGFWAPSKNTRVSAVLITSINPQSLLSSTIHAHLYLNPWPQYPYEGVLTQLDTYRGDDKGKIQHTEGRNLLDILKINNSIYCD